MSEQTPDTNNGMSDGQDPSMEDILASIRKIIADDDTQGYSDLETDEEILELEATEGDVAELAHVETLDLDIIEDDAPAVEADIDALIGDIDAGSVDDLAAPEIERAPTSDEMLDDVLDLEIPMIEPELSEPLVAEDSSLGLEDEMVDLLVDTDDEIVSRADDPKSSRGLMGGAMAALGLGGAAVAAKASDAVEPAGDDLSLMLDNMLEDSASYQEAAPARGELVIDPADDLLSEIDFADEIDAAETSSTETDPDMDLVKSLMADLTEEPLHEEDVAEDLELETSTLDIDDEADASSDDVMDEILTMTLDDETKLSEEIEIPNFRAELAEDAAVESLSLKDIAAAAQAEAQASEAGLPTSVIAGLGAAAIGGAAAGVMHDDEPEAELEPETDDVDAALSQLDEMLADDTESLEDVIPEEPAHITPEPLIEETTPMARAKKSDAIIDEVTESATAGAFASLTNVVEEKATVAERGDRIGDLVMEALQPMLKEWLDANLKGIVERAVTKEVKRISSGK